MVVEILTGSSLLSFHKSNLAEHSPVCAQPYHSRAPFLLVPVELGFSSFLMLQQLWKL